MPSEWAYKVAREQRRDVETMATNLDAARAQGRREGLEEAAGITRLAFYANQARDRIRARIEMSQPKFETTKTTDELAP